jgi:hypothetical protein
LLHRMAATLSLFELALGKTVGRLLRDRVESELKAQGVPLGVFIVPDHLRQLGGLYSDPELWPTLYGLQHDEKDVYRVIGPAGIQDWGDGDAQEILFKHEALIGALDASTKELGGLAAASQISIVLYGTVVDALGRAGAALERACRLLLDRAPAMEAKRAKLTRKRDALVAGRIADRERYEKHISFLSSRLSEAKTFAAQASTYCSAVAALPQSATAAETATQLMALVADGRGLVEKCFGFEHMAASKVRAPLGRSLLHRPTHTHRGPRAPRPHAPRPHAPR